MRSAVCIYTYTAAEKGGGSVTALAVVRLYPYVVCMYSVEYKHSVSPLQGNRLPGNLKHLGKGSMVSSGMIDDCLN